tara:strand:- start:350 stop:538 length:189 start_codon:yes stop_codon:yes gene_type:complete
MKYYGLSNEGDMYSLGKCKDLQEANEVADEIGIDIVSLIDGERAESWAKFILKTLDEEDDDE